MDDRRNGVIHRTAFVAASSPTTSPIANGEAGLWHKAFKWLYRRSGPPYVDTGLFQQRGCIPAARCSGGTPVNGNVFAIGAGTYQFVTTLTTIQTYTQIKVLGSAALSWAAALDAINGVTNANVVPGSTSTTVAIVADMVSATELRIRLADARGGNPIAGVSTSQALTATIGGGGVWSCANLNVAGKAESDCQASRFSVGITAGMITKGSYQAELPYTPAVYSFQCYSAAGLLLAATDLITISGNAINIALAGGGAPKLVATDIVAIEACE